MWHEVILFLIWQLFVPFLIVVNQQKIILDVPNWLAHSTMLQKVFMNCNLNFKSLESVVCNETYFVILPAAWNITWIFIQKMCLLRKYLWLIDMRNKLLTVRALSGNHCLEDPKGDSAASNMFYLGSGIFLASFQHHIDGLMQDCCISIDNTL